MNKNLLTDLENVTMNLTECSRPMANTIVYHIITEWEIKKIKKYKITIYDSYFGDTIQEIESNTMHNAIITAKENYIKKYNHKDLSINDIKTITKIII